VENTPNNQSSELSGNVLFYKNPQPLSPEQHAGLGIKSTDQPFGFLREAHAIPLTVSEFGMAATAYPIIFVGSEFSPIAVMGVRQGENVFVREDGTMVPDFYVPAFVRRYPFVFANDEKSDRLLLCVDRDAPMVTNQPEIPFFENGEATEFTTNAVDFCKEFERQRRGTVDFAALMKKYDLFEQKTVNFQPRDEQGKEAGEPQKVADYWAVDEGRLNALSETQFNELRINGALSAIYAHLVSLLNWQRIITRAILADQAKTQA